MMCYAAPATWRSFQMCLTVPMSMRTPIRCALLPIINASRHGVSHQRRAGAVAPLVYVGGQQLDDVFDTFKQCQLTPEPAIEISGASGVTLILALAAGTSWRGHAPGPDGLPGGYPVCLERASLFSICPNPSRVKKRLLGMRALKQQMDLSLKMERCATKLASMLEEEKFQHAEGFEAKELERVCNDMALLRDRLMSEPT